MFVDQRAIDFFTSDAILVKINAEVDTLAAQKYHVSGYPTTVLIDKDGSEVDRLAGYAPTEEYLGTLANYLLGIGTLAHYLDSAQTVEDRDLYFTIANKYKYRGGSEDAVTWYEKVIAMGEPRDSLSGTSRISMADMFRRSKEYDRSLEAFKAIEADFRGTDFAADAGLYRGVVYRAMGDTTKAVAEFQRVAEDNPDSDYSEYALRQIELLTAPPEGAQ